MKRIIFSALVFCASVISVNATTPNTSVSATIHGLPLEHVLKSYYEVKNALVDGNADLASTKAGEMVKALAAVDMKGLSDADQKSFTALQAKLNLDAKHISESKEIAHQRDHFSSLSNNMYTLAKEVKMSEVPVYQAYCPMKKMYWLSNEDVIKNPYYGKSMLSCGSVKDVIK